MTSEPDSGSGDSERIINIRLCYQSPYVPLPLVNILLCVQIFNKQVSYNKLAKVALLYLQVHALVVF